MSSLHDLLAQEGFRRRKPHRQAKPMDSHNRYQPDEAGPAVAAAVSLCRDRRSVDLSRSRRWSDRQSCNNGSSSFSSKRSSSNSAAKSNQRSKGLTTTDQSSWQEDEPAAARAVVSILAGYVGRFYKDAAFRREMREKCSACLAGRGKGGAEHALLVNLEMGMESIERVAEEGGGRHRGHHHSGGSKGSKIRSLRNSITLLSIVASLNSPDSRNSHTCGVPNSHLSACAQLYLSIVYKMERDDRAAARHLLQAFCDAPRLARRSLLPDLWEHFFLPHLLHLQVWYNGEMEVATSELDAGEERKQRMKVLNRVYHDQIDMGTAQFALYYKEWLKVGRAAAPVIPLVSLPSVPNYGEVSGRRSVPLSPCAANRTLYQAVFGPSCDRDGDDAGDTASLENVVDAEREGGTEEGSCKHGNSAHRDMGVRQRLSQTSKENPAAESASTPRKSYSFRLFSCRSDPKKGAICPTQIPRAATPEIPKEAEADPSSPNLGHAVNLISSADSLAECEFAIRVISKAWLDSHGDPSVEAAISTAPVIEGLLEVSFASKDEETLEMTICILAELVARGEVNRQVVLNADPQLEIFLRLLGIRGLFLKAAVLLYLLKPRAKQMLSAEWVPLVLQILEHGDQKQTLFTVQCRAKSAAFYFLDQLLTGFDVDRNVENAKQVVFMGGLRLLIRRLETGDARERKNAASLLTACVRADGSCRAYLATNIRKASILELLVGNQLKSNGCALSLLVELVKLSRRSQISMFLNGLKSEGCLNTMHVLLVYLQQAPAEQRPLVAAILLQLDLLSTHQAIMLQGDNLQYSVYREEGIDALVTAMDCSSSKKVQEHCSKALSILGGRFSSTGEATTEAWLLKRAGFDDNPSYAFRSKETRADRIARMDEEEVEAEDWQRRLAIILLNRGNKRFLTSLSNCIADGIPSLARLCLVTVAWMSIALASLPSNSSVWPLASPVLMPKLLDCLNYDRAIEERVLASFSLFNFSKNPECRSKLLPLDKQCGTLLHDLAHVTWTAREIILSDTDDPLSFIKL
ncbi:hypothetical protein Taro_045765 [Colocasia esculenta]|uniref:E3 ubiquitin-protein ligase LIN-1 n=1 Tax=Colocasia esculenta TaxID=4460 RepID=A0A843WXD4_COLES|nr:hypothetical protein [Colocasia esculenta]